MTACFSSSLYNMLVLVISFLVSEYLRKCYSLSVCKLPAYYAWFQASVTGRTVGPIFEPNNPEERSSLLLLPANYVRQVNCESCNQ